MSRRIEEMCPEENLLGPISPPSSTKRKVIGTKKPT